MEEKEYEVEIHRDGSKIGEFRFKTREEAVALSLRIAKDPLYIECGVTAWIVTNPVKSTKFVEPLVTFGGY
jgi:hypothetical protein